MFDTRITCKVSLPGTNGEINLSAPASKHSTANIQIADSLSKQAMRIIETWGEVIGPHLGKYQTIDFDDVERIALEIYIRGDNAIHPDNALKAAKAFLERRDLRRERESEATDAEESE